MFNSVDQLASRFPLCAREELFIPGIIETLTGEGATSIVIAVDEKGQPPEQYGLLPMADLIIDFQPEVFEKEEYYRLLIGGKTAKKGVTVPEGVKGKQHREEIVLKVVRFAGGQRAGARGILELAPTTEVYRNKGLNFTPLPDFVPRSRLNQADASL